MIQDYIDLAVNALNPIDFKQGGRAEFSDGKKLSPMAIPSFDSKPVEVVDVSEMPSNVGLMDSILSFVSDRFYDPSEKDLHTQTDSRHSLLEGETVWHSDEGSHVDEPDSFARLMEEADGAWLAHTPDPHLTDRSNLDKKPEQMRDTMKTPVNDFDGMLTDFTLEDAGGALNFNLVEPQSAKPANDLGHSIHLEVDDVIGLGNNLFITGDELDFIEFVEAGWDKLEEPMELSSDTDAHQGYDTFVHESGAIVHIENLISTNYDEPGPA